MSKNKLQPESSSAIDKILADIAELRRRIDSIEKDEP